MPSKQTRRSISLKKDSYERLRTYCLEQNISMSSFVEARIAVFFDTQDAVQATRTTVTAKPFQVQDIVKERLTIRLSEPPRGGGNHEF